MYVCFNLGMKVMVIDHSVMYNQQIHYIYIKIYYYILNMCTLFSIPEI